MQTFLIAEKGMRCLQAQQACSLNLVSPWSSCRVCPRERASGPQFTEMCHSRSNAKPINTPDSPCQSDQISISQVAPSELAGGMSVRDEAGTYSQWGLWPFRGLEPGPRGNEGGAE